MADDDEESAQKHVIYARNENLHESVGAYEGGRCCCEHEAKYLPSNSCAHRWQACFRAEGEDAPIYGPDLSTQFRARPPDAAMAMFKNLALASAPGPIQTANDDGHEYRRIEGKPFRTAFAPWTNQVHHLLPNAVLKDAIIKTASDYPSVEDAIVRGLMKHKYNINLWKNCMILPCEEPVGCKLSLPTHLGSHGDYSAEVLPRVMQILAPYKKVVRAIKQKKKHPKPKLENIVKKLDALAETLHGAVLAMRPDVAKRCAKPESINVNAFAATVKKSLGV